jgi:hypothetical protein
VEEKSMNDMRKGTAVFLKKLRSLGAEKVGIYVGHHLYKSFNLDLSEADAVWIPHYGKNDGTVNSKPDFPADIHQYTDKGKLPGYAGNLDLNRIISDKKLSFFTGAKTVKPAETQTGSTTVKVDKYKVIKSIGGYVTAANAKNRTSRAGSVSAGTYYVFNRSQGMINVTKRVGQPGSWINPDDNAELKVGSRVKVKSTASRYVTGEKIPQYVKGKTYTVQQIRGSGVLLKEILSWVKKSDLQ